MSTNGVVAPPVTSPRVWLVLIRADSTLAAEWEVDVPRGACLTLRRVMWACGGRWQSAWSNLKDDTHARLSREGRRPCGIQREPIIFLVILIIRRRIMGIVYSSLAGGCVNSEPY
uniref:Uncharacterized protein n=1 Tax=Timema poppense TaxID=170557 RepID=A0A7R9H8A1_TIMPO|nr:unnamed protein product [Timema poppensis]